MSALDLPYLCVLCRYRDNVAAGAFYTIDGHSFCAQHAEDVIERADYVWFDSHDRFHLRSTIQNNKRGSES